MASGLAITVTTLVICFGLSLSACPSKWFGAKCQFRCHCRNGENCDSSGRCPGGCEGGFFGDACQYRDVAWGEWHYNQQGTRGSWATDGNDESCKELSEPGVLEVEFSLRRYFSWLQLVFKHPIALDYGSNRVRVHFKQSDNRVVLCRDGQKFTEPIQSDGRTWELHCKVDTLVKRVVITGGPVQHICSVYVSGGRNMALKQKTWQTSTKLHFLNNEPLKSDKAVDGVINNQHVLGSSHTADYDSHPVFKLYFASRIIVNQIKIYNRGNCCQERLNRFKLVGFLSNSTTSKEVYKYQDRSDEKRFVIRLHGPSTRAPMNRIEISSNKWYLTLNEVQVWGECTPGYHGLGCEKCRNGTFGAQCAGRCDDCKDRACDHVNGTCL